VRFRRSPPQAKPCARPAPRGGGGVAGLKGRSALLPFAHLDHLHKFQERSSLVSCEHRPLLSFVPFVPILGGAFGGDQVGPPFEGPLAAMAARDDRRNALVVSG